jgi:hypothetical protein
VGCPSRPPSIENMNYEGRACRRRKKRSARVEVKTTPNHNEKEEKQANDQRALFDLREHDDPPMRLRNLRLLQTLFPSAS